MVGIFASTATAQDNNVKYHGEVFAAGDASWANVTYEGERFSDNGNGRMYGASLHTIQGVKINDRFALGIGLGLDFLVSDEELNGLLIPIYLDFKYYIPTKGKITPFVMAEGGGSFAIYPQTIAPLYGAGVGFKTGKFSMSLGYMREGFRFREFIEENDSVNFYQHKLQLRVGVTF